MNSKIACFGIPSILSFKSKVCGSCVEFADCQKDAYIALNAIREYPIATTMLKQHEEYRIASGQTEVVLADVNLTKQVPLPNKRLVTRYALTTQQLERIALLPKKIGNFLEKVWVRGLDKHIHSDIVKGINPFNENKARAYHKAFEILNQGRAHRSKMSNELMNQLGWTYASAYSQVSMIWQIFPELGIAKEEGMFLVKSIPEYLDHNNQN